MIKKKGCPFAQKDLIRVNDNISVYYTPRSQFDSKDDEDKDKKTK